MTKREVDEKYSELIDSYLNVKPLLIDLYKRNGNRHIDGILNEIRALNDHVARCYREGTTFEQAYGELCKAEGHLKRLIYDSFKQLNIIFYDTVEEYERRNFGAHWVCLDGGDFWERYTACRKEVTKAVEEAKNSESMDSERAFAKYQSAYVTQGMVYDMLEANKESLELDWCRKLGNVVKTNKSWFWSTVALAVIPSLIWEAYCNWSWIEDWFCNGLESVRFAVGGWLMGF